RNASQRSTVSTRTFTLLTCDTLSPLVPHLRREILVRQLTDDWFREPIVQCARGGQQRLNVCIGKNRTCSARVTKVGRGFIRADVVKLFQHRAVRTGRRLERVDLAGIGKESQKG